MTQSFFWYELMTSDPKAAKDFYADVVGWTPQAFGGQQAQPNHGARPAQPALFLAAPS